MISEVETTLTALDVPDEHVAAAALARLYARQLDTAEAAESAADAVLALAKLEGADVELEEVIQGLRNKLAARTAVATIGPRLADLLGALLATPKAAGAKPTAEPVKTGATVGSLARLRAVSSG